MSESEKLQGRKVGRNITKSSYEKILNRLRLLKVDNELVDNVSIILKEELLFDPNGIKRDQKDFQREYARKRREKCKSEGITTYEAFTKKSYYNKKSQKGT